MTEVYGHIYLVTNLVTGMQYVGMKKGKWEDFATTYWGSSQYLSAEIAEYGLENFSKILLEEVYSCSCGFPELDEKSLALAEHIWIKRLNTLYPNGINRSEGTLEFWGWQKAKTSEELSEIGRRAAHARWSKLGPEERSAAAKLREANMSCEQKLKRIRNQHKTLGPEGRSKIAHKRNATLGPEGLRSRARKGIETMGPDGLRERALSVAAALGPEGCSARARKRIQNMTPERRREIALKSAETKRRMRAELKNEESDDTICKEHGQAPSQ